MLPVGERHAFHAASQYREGAGRRGQPHGDGLGVGDSLVPEAAGLQAPSRGRELREPVPVILDLFWKLIEKFANLGILQRLGLAFDAAQDLHRVRAAQPIAERSESRPGVPIPLLPPPDLFVVHEPAKDPLQAQDAVEGQAERRQPFFEVLVYEGRETSDRSLGQLDAQAVRDREHAGGVVGSVRELPRPAEIGRVAY